MSPNAICISCGPATATTSPVKAANAATAQSVERTDRRKASSPSPVAPERRRVRWGSRLVATAWKSCSGARAIISTLKMKPAAAALVVAFTSSGPAFRNACSLSMITSTAAAKPLPWASVKAGAPPSESPVGAGARRLAAHAAADRERDDQEARERRDRRSRSRWRSART